MRLSLVDDYEDGDFTSIQSQDSISLDIAASKDKHSASYTNLFDPSQTTPVGATYQQARATSSSPRDTQQARATSSSPRNTKRNTNREDLRYDHSPRPKQVLPPSLNRSAKPPLALPEDFLPTEKSRPQKNRPNINSPGAERSNSGVVKPRTGQTRSPNDRTRDHEGQRSQKVNGYPIRSSSEERTGDSDRKLLEVNNTSRRYNRQPEDRTRRSLEYLDKRDGNHHYHQQGTSKTLPNQNRFVNNVPANQNRYANEAGDNPEDGDYKRPMSFVKALEMSEIMQTRDKDQKERQRREAEKKKSVYDSAYEIAV